MKFEHWHIEQDADDIIWLGLDVVGKSVNVLTVAVLHELADISQQLVDTPPAGLVLHSLKSRSFIFGADINEFEAFTSEDEIKAHIGVTLNAIQRIEDLPCPTVALVDGVALGGGCELVLGFDVIVGLDDPSVQIGFPEVNLGLLPGYGGTGRMFKRAGLTTALNMVLHGKPLKAKAALSKPNLFSKSISHVAINKPPSETSCAPVNSLLLFSVIIVSIICFSVFKSIGGGAPSKLSEIIS